MGYRTSRRHVDALALAIATGGPQIVRERLAASPALAKHWRPIHEAALHGRCEIVRLLLDAGADPNAIAEVHGAIGATRPLHRAVAVSAEAPRGPEHDRVVGLLLERGADPNARGGERRLRPLELAMLTGARRFATILVRGGAIVDSYAAAALGDLAATTRNLDEGFVVDAPDQNGMTALHYAAASQVDPRDPDALATRRRLREVADMLLDAGASVGDTPGGPFESAAHHDAFGQQENAEQHDAPTRRTALEWAVGHATNGFLICTLLERGADPNRGDVLLRALLLGAIDVAALLVQAGADVDLLTRSGEPPQVALARWGRSAMVEWLLTYGADPNARSINGDTALLAAVRRGLPTRTVRRLLECGADRSIRDARGRNAFDLAEERNLRDLIDLLAND